jgi:hypothetical protein
MTDTDTTTQALKNAGDATEAAIKTDAADAAKVAETEAGTMKTDVAAAETKVETAVDAVKADVAGDASGVGKALSADAAAVETEAKTLEADTTTDIQKAKASVEAAVAHIDNSGIVSSELTKAKSLLTHILRYIEAHI